MDVSFVAFVLGVINLALLGLLFLAWRRDKGEPSWRLKMALRLQEHDRRMNELNGLLKKQDELRKVVRAELSERVDGLEMVNDAEHRALRNALLGAGKEAQDGQD